MAPRTFHPNEQSLLGIKKCSVKTSARLQKACFAGDLGNFRIGHLQVWAGLRGTQFSYFARVYFLSNKGLEAVGLSTSRNYSYFWPEVMGTR